MNGITVNGMLRTTALALLPALCLSLPCQALERSARRGRQPSLYLEKPAVQPGSGESQECGNLSRKRQKNSELMQELEDVLNESIDEALAEQQRLFEKKYARLYSSRTFWHRVALGEGAVIAASVFAFVMANR